MDEPEQACKCLECKRTYRMSELSWTYDRYGIPWRKACSMCYEKVQSEIQKWTFYAGEAGEYLNEG